jgi:lysophospholipase L1-like esterase
MPIRLLALGDSYTVGERVGKIEAWPIQLIRALRSSGRGAEEPTTVAVSGWDTRDLIEALNLSDLESPFDVVTLQIGVNNQFRNGTVSDFEVGLSNLIEKAIDLAGGNVANVVLISIPDWSVTPFAEGAPKQDIAKSIDEFNAVILELAEESGAKFVDITAISRRAGEQPELIAADGLHPSAEMYAEWVELILPVVEEIIE